MMKQIRDNLKGCYPAGCEKELEEMEQSLLHFQKFDQEEAVKLGVKILECGKAYGNMFVNIQRMSDQESLFQSMGDTCQKRNQEFAELKRNTVLQTMHCSLWAMAYEQINGGLDEIFEDQNHCLAVGGAFPIFVDGVLHATITSSGLHDGMDHKVIVDALKEMHGFTEKVQITPFSGKFI